MQVKLLQLDTGVGCGELAVRLAGHDIADSAVSPRGPPGGFPSEAAIVIAVMHVCMCPHQAVKDRPPLLGRNHREGLIFFVRRL
jgi:hypothetical protein